MNWHGHPDAARIVKENWHRAEAFIVAQREPCIEIRDDELRTIGDNRLLRGGLPEDLDAWKRPESWFIAVIVCPGDDTRAIAAYVKRNRLDPDRVHFYLHPQASNQALSAWRDAGYRLDHVDDRTPTGTPIKDWEALHKLLGLHLNIQIVEDFLPSYEEP